VMLPDRGSEVGLELVVGELVLDLLPPDLPDLELPPPPDLPDLVPPDSQMSLGLMQWVELLLDLEDLVEPSAVDLEDLAEVTFCWRSLSRSLRSFLRFPAPASVS